MCACAEEVGVLIPLERQWIKMWMCVSCKRGWLEQKLKLKIL